jgi:ABC-type phosphate transport system substrate-binding protein
MRENYLYKLKTVLWAVLFLSAISAVHADISIVVNPGNESSLSQEEIKNIFLGKKSRFPNSVTVKSVDQQSDSPIRKEFYTKLAGMDDNDVKAYWAVLIFTGNASPPKTLSNDEAVKAYVKGNPAGLGYIDSKSVDASVKVVFTLK